MLVGAVDRQSGLTVGETGARIAAVFRRRPRSVMRLQQHLGVGFLLAERDKLGCQFLRQVGLTGRGLVMEP